MSDLLAGFHSISNRCKNYYWTVKSSRELKVRQMEIHATELPVSVPTVFEVEAVVKFYHIYIH